MMRGGDGHWWRANDNEVTVTDLDDAELEGGSEMRAYMVRVRECE